MTTYPISLPGRVARPAPRVRRQWLAMLSLLSSIGLVAACAYVYMSVLPASANSDAPLLAGLEHRSYRPGQTAILQLTGSGVTRATLQVFLAGAIGGDAPLTPKPGWDKHTFGEPVTTPRVVTRPTGSATWTVPLQLGATWPSGDYVARLTWPGGSDYAPFILRPRTLGAAHVLVIEPTNTWHAYNVYAGDSWYLNPGVHTIDLAYPFADHDVRGGVVPAGLPEQFWRLDTGFLRWYWHSGYRADFFSDDDLENITSVSQLLKYRLVVFGGHEEYVTSKVYKLMTQYRNAGGNIAFLSANNFFYKVSVSGNTMTGRTRWRDIGQPEASLIGAQYVGWNEANYTNHPYHLINREAAPWLFQGTGLLDGATFGNYGIEIDEPSTVSPDDTDVLAEIPHEFGTKAADMTIYRMGNSTVFDAGVFNFAASAHWPKISRLVSNLWGHMSGETPAP